jgi:uncharacterized protein YaaR (DUF327 family)
MSISFSDVLAQINDPELIRELRSEVDTDPTTGDTTLSFSESVIQINDKELIDRVFDAIELDKSFKSTEENSAEMKTIQTWYEKYLLRRKNRSPATLAQYKRTIPTFIKYANSKGIEYPTNITNEIVDSFVEYLFDKYDADATILTYTKNVRAWLKFVLSVTSDKTC